MRGAPPPPRLEPGADADADAALLLLTRALLARLPATRGDDVHAGLLRLLLRGSGGASAANDGLATVAGAGAAKAVPGDATGCANVAAVTAWR